MKITAEPRSDQINADDFVGSPATYTIAGVRTGTAEQKYDIDLAEVQGRAWRPPLTMLRLLIAAWGDDATAWTGRRVTLYRDETVRFGPDAVGGIRVSHMSDLPTGKKPFTVKLTATRGRRVAVTVQPLDDAVTPDPSQAAVDAFARGGITQDQLEQHVEKPRAEWSIADVKTLTDLFTDLRDKKVTKDEVFGTPPPGGNDDPWAQDTLTSEAPA